MGCTLGETFPVSLTASVKYTVVKTFLLDHEMVMVILDGHVDSLGSDDLGELRAEVDRGGLSEGLFRLIRSAQVVRNMEN